MYVVYLKIMLAGWKFASDRPSSWLKEKQVYCCWKRCDLFIPRTSFCSPRSMVSMVQHYPVRYIRVLSLFSLCHGFFFIGRVVRHEFMVCYSTQGRTCGNSLLSMCLYVCYNSLLESIFLFDNWNFLFIWSMILWTKGRKLAATTGMGETTQQLGN